ncbi:hypothetical protein B9G69_005985 [Bdellovibrio sp. SKB1291214]|uniref:hypothetical protein n=1 Tax=Bdellovibrio sp. SKB1291214 TaxID=1732569 RepID=UPI000B51CAEC|nr:hypothetical protein [Bdellovibrio sp. SKB1291214]UYL10127.1 hypothetical protein B9G69_005985 [Bdellovibrio sp. SKB1291214]
MRQRIVLTLLALLPLCATAQANTSSSNDLKVTLKPEPGYVKQKRVVKTWSVYPTRRVVYEAPQTKGSATNNQALLTKTYIDPTQKRMPASVAKPVIAKQTKPVAAKTVVAKNNVKVVKPVAVAKAAPAIKANRAPASVQTAAVKPAATSAVAPNTLVLEPMTVKAAKAKPIQKRQIAKISPYEAGMAKVTRASSPKKSSGLVGRKKIAYNQ